MNKIFGVSFVPSGSRQSGSKATNTHASAAAQRQGKMPLAQIKQQMDQCMHDMPGIEAERLRYKIAAARTASDLWLLRSDMYQTIAKLKDQSEAALRINGLLSCFAQWLPDRQLSRI